MSDIGAQMVRVEQAILELTALTEALTKKQANTIRKAKRLSILSIVGVIVVLLLSVQSIRTAQRASHNAAMVARLQQRTSDAALCPLYDRLLDVYNPATPTALADPLAYDQSYDVIEAGARVLGCAHHVRGKN